MSFIQGDTRWVLFLSSRGEPEDRHVLDLAYGLFCLESAGISPSSIFIYIDGEGRERIEQLMSLGSANSYQIGRSEDFFVDLESNSSPGMVMFVSGHGDINGIDAVSPITPYRLITAIKSASSLSRAVVYLGQCYAGIFNYIGAGNRLRNAPDGPDVILIGATSLHQSISSSTTERLLSGELPWVANIFLLHVFKWISNPFDVDGDGRTTIIDSFKYAGAVSNHQNKEVKAKSFMRSMDIYSQYVDARNAAENSDEASMESLRAQALWSQCFYELQIRYTHQECWVLNAIPAQDWDI